MNAPQSKPGNRNRRLLYGGAALFLILCCCGAFAVWAASNQTTAPTTAPTSVPDLGATVVVSTSTAGPTEILSPTDTLLPAVSPQTNVCVFCNLECPRNQGDSYFCITDPQLAADPSLFEKTLRTFCDTQAGDFCEALVWTDATYLPSSFPMSDESVFYQVADYTRNKNTGYDCFILFSQGNETHRSGQC